jgi:putative hydrolase of the HAD superfamily
MREPLPKAIFFDLDDTIVALSASADLTWDQVCRSFAPRVGVTPDELFEAIKAARTWFWGDVERHRKMRFELRQARREIVAAALSRLSRPAGVSRDASTRAPLPASHPAAEATLINAIADTYTSERDEAIRPLPGAIETLRQLKRRGIQLALLTNGPAEWQRYKIDRFQLAPFFDCIVIEGEFGAGKPDERVYRYAMERLNVTPEQTWMVGDHPEWDVGAPQGLGIRGIWVDPAGREFPEDSPVRPDRVIRALPELLHEDKP